MKILDFGLAKLVPVEEATASSLTKPGVLMGTVAYMSPEQVRERFSAGHDLALALEAVLAAAQARPCGRPHSSIRTFGAPSARCLGSTRLDPG